MKNKNLKILLHDFSFNKNTLVLKNYLDIYFEQVFFVQDPDNFELDLIKFQYSIIILMPDVWMFHGDKIIKRIRCIKPMVPLLFISKKNGRNKAFDSRVIHQTFKEKIESILQDVKEKIFHACEREYLNWPRLKTAAGNTYTTTQEILGYSTWIEDVRKKINKYQGKKVFVVIIGPPGTEKLNVVNSILEPGEHRVHDPLVMSFNRSGALVSTIPIAGNLLGQENRDISRVSLLESLSFQPVVLMDIEKSCPYVQYVFSNILKDTILTVPDKNICNLFILVSDKNLLQDDLLDVINHMDQIIQLPALNQRQEDIALLVNYYVKKYSQQYEKHVEISETAINKLIDYEWPGNLQELEKMIKLIIETFTGEMLMPADMDFSKTEKKV